MLFQSEKDNTIISYVLFADPVRVIPFCGRFSNSKNETQALFPGSLQNKHSIDTFI